MAFTTESEITFVNQVLDRIGAAQITLADQAGNLEATAAFRNWSVTLNSLIRSFTWPFLTDRTELVQIQTLTLDDAPTPAAFSEGALLTGGTSGTTATVLAAVSDTVYIVAYTSDDWTDGETLTDDADTPNSRDCATGYPTTTATTPVYEWSYQYELPTNFLRLVDVWEDDGTDAVDLRWTLEGNRILTNYETCNIKYIKTISDPDDFDPLFAEVMLLRLALKLIPILAGSLSQVNREQLQNELQTAEAKARSVCSQENNQTGREDWNLARYGS
jgi:hypothetical protein